MPSFRTVAVWLFIGLVPAGTIAAPPEAAAAGPQTVIKKLERFLTGGSRKARPKSRKARTGNKSRKQAPPEAGRPAADAGKQAGSARSRRSEEKRAPSSKAAAGTAALSAGAALPAAVPLPPEKPRAPEKPEASEQLVPRSDAAVAAAPLPTPDPRQTVPETEGPLAETTPSPLPKAGEVEPQQVAGDEQACRAQLRAMGVVFTERPPEAEGGCSIPHPIFVMRLSAAVALEPGGLMNCALAETTARFVRDVVQPASRTEMGSELASIGQASAYVCRTRHGTAKLSEHAFGNALDIARFSFADRAVADVGPAPGDRQDRFLRKVRAAACGPFKTVLGPGSNADHATHFHLDLAERRHGGTYCR